jgi:hypothetical protein
MFRLLRVAYSSSFNKIVPNVYLFFFGFDLTPLQDLLLNSDSGPLLDCGYGFHIHHQRVACFLYLQVHWQAVSEPMAPRGYL